MNSVKCQIIKVLNIKDVNISGNKNIRIGKFEFVAKTQFLYVKNSN